MTRRARILQAVAALLGVERAQRFEASLLPVLIRAWRYGKAAAHIVRHVPHSVLHLPETYWSGIYRLCFLYVLCLERSAPACWQYLYRLCLALVRLRGQTILRRVWRLSDMRDLTGKR
jgi:hypothetical protein